MSASSKSSLFAFSKRTLNTKMNGSLLLISLRVFTARVCFPPSLHLTLYPLPQMDSLEELTSIGQGQSLSFILPIDLTVTQVGSHKVAAKLVRALTDHKVRKTYIALCVGSAAQWRKITVRSGHGRSKFGAWRVYAASDVGRTVSGGSVIRDMETSFEVLLINGKGSFKEPSEFTNDEGFTVVVEQKAVRKDVMEDEILVRAYPRSGRTHQIRLHCQYLGISIKRAR